MEADTRPLSEKLADYRDTTELVSVIDLRNGSEFRIIGNAHDIERVRAACKAQMKRIESDKLDPSDRFTVVVPAREN
jgi:hypothetical protein